MGCHPGPVPRIRLHSPDRVSVHVLHQPQPWASFQEKSSKDLISPVQQLAHHQLLIFKWSTDGGGNLQPSAAVEVTSSQQPFEFVFKYDDFCGIA